MKTLISILLFSLLSCFNLSHAQLIGPDAPDVIVSYTSSPTPGFLFHLSNSPTNNNYLENYAEFDPSIDSTAPDQLFKFQGYLIFQLTSDTIDVTETLNPAYSQLAAVVDVSDTVTTVHLIWDGCNPTPLLLGNTGTANDILVSNNAFTASPFIENETYCFRVLAFGTNPFSEDPTCGISNYALYGDTQANTGTVLAYCAESVETAGLFEQDVQRVHSYPNPTDGVVFIETLSDGSLNELVVFDELGRVVEERTFSENKIALDLPYAGVFTVRINNNGQYFHTKVIRL